MEPDATHFEKKGQVTMVYTDDVRKKLDAILKAFGNYIDGQNYFDYNGPRNPDHGWKKDREHGRIGESTERGNKPWHEQRTARSSRQSYLSFRKNQDGQKLK